MSSSTAEFVKSSNGINRSHITKSYILDTSTDTIHKMENKEYLTEEEALKDGPLTDVQKTVSVARSSVKLKGTCSLKIDLPLSLICVDGRAHVHTHTRETDNMGIWWYFSGHFVIFLHTKRMLYQTYVVFYGDL